MSLYIGWDFWSQSLSDSWALDPPLCSSDCQMDCHEIDPLTFSSANVRSAFVVFD